MEIYLGFIETILDEAERKINTDYRTNPYVVGDEIHNIRGRILARLNIEFKHAFKQIVKNRNDPDLEKSLFKLLNDFPVEEDDEDEY